MNKFKAIETFLCVVDTGSFTAAARRLNISPSSVTRIIKDLEDDLGVLLLKRTTRSFVLTSTGRHFYKDNKEIMIRLAEAEMAAKSSYEQPVGHLNVSAPIMFGAMHVTPMITEFISKYPQTTVGARFTDTRVDLVKEDIDVTIRIGALKDSTMIARRLSSVSWASVLRPLTWRSMARLSLSRCAFTAQYD